MKTFAAKSTTDINASIGIRRSSFRERQHATPTVAHRNGARINAGRVIPNNVGVVYRGKRRKSRYSKGVVISNNRACSQILFTLRRISQIAQPTPIGNKCAGGGQV